ncbi:MAG: fibrillarin-like rRNA/tRNA 2'-O-methyltransferase [Candidatus Parvarchaeota archaeon]|nr:fibrillarin-like rRNA/tRNA 2'-O-methyltransferase [Candidatus Parvarchaeota archaeon]
MEIEKVIDNVYWIKNNGSRILTTLNFKQGVSVYGERIFRLNGREYREWIPSRSKLAAAIYKGFKPVGLREGISVLYLGASTGTTLSHISDIIGREGKAFAVEISEEIGVRLILLAENRKNIYPIIYDAAKLEDKGSILQRCDFLYEDIAQKDQVGIFIKNANNFLKRGGYGAIAVKARSIDVLSPPKEVIERARQELSKRFSIMKLIDLYPFQKDHAIIFVKN